MRRLDFLVSDVVLVVQERSSLMWTPRNLVLLTDQGGFWSEDSPEDNFKLVPVTRLHFVNKHTPTICSAIWQRRLRTLSSASGWVVYAEGNQSVVNHRWPYNPSPKIVQNYLCVCGHGFTDISAWHCMCLLMKHFNIGVGNSGSSKSSKLKWC